MSLEAPNSQTERLRAAVTGFVDSRQDDYFRRIPPYALETMVGIAVEVLQIPADELTVEALKADRELARLRERLGLNSSSSTLAFVGDLEDRLKETGREQEQIKSITDVQLRTGIAEKRARLVVTEAFQTSPSAQGIGWDQHNAPVDFCWQAVRETIPLLDEAVEENVEPIW